MSLESVEEGKARRRVTFKTIAFKALEAAEKPKKVSRARKVFRILVFLLFTAGFLYQVIRFLTFLLDYPTVVSIEIKSPNLYMSPAFTFCNNERIKRSLYCEKYPDRCEEPSEELCKRYPDYCGTNETLVPNENYQSARYDPNDIIEMSHNFTDLLTSDYDDSEDKALKVMRSRLFGFNEYSGCFVMNYRANSNKPPPMIHRNEFFIREPYYSFVFDPKTSDSFDPKTKPGIYFSIHSPFEDINPFQKGIFMKPGRMYKITVLMREENLLPPPYKTDCMSYLELWEKNNKTGSRSQEACRHKCVADVIEKCANCSLVLVNTYNGLIPCESETFLEKWGNCDANNSESLAIFECYNGCKEECKYTDYKFETQDRYIDLSRHNSSIRTDITKIYVDVDIDDTEVMSFSYRPQYQEIEAFSYIGGFIGIWLGVSLVQITDFLENTFLFMRKCFRKKAKKSETE